jgi:acyl carrier protein
LVLIFKINVEFSFENKGLLLYAFKPKGPFKNYMENLEKFLNAFSQSLTIPKEKIVDDLAYQGISEWDSITHMILISQLEDTFGISIDTDDVIDMSSVGKAKEILAKYNIKL